MKKFTLKNTVLVFLLVLFAVSFVRQYNQIKKLDKQMKEKGQQLQSLKESNELLQQKVDSINTDEFSEKLARERLGLVKNGEKVVNDTGENKNSK